MKSLWTLRVSALIFFLGFASPLVFAGDCSGPGDCGEARDNAPKAAGVAAGLTALALAARASNGSEPGPEAPAEPKEEQGESIASTPEQALGGDDSGAEPDGGDQPKGEDKGEGIASSPDQALGGEDDKGN